MANNIFLEPGQTFRVVNHNEPLQAHFLVREKFEDPDLDGGWFRRDESWLGTAWHTVEEELPAWIGNSYNDLNDTNTGSIKFYYEIIEIIDL